MNSSPVQMERLLLAGDLCHRRRGGRGGLANSPASTRHRKSPNDLSVRYGLPAMFTVTNQPLRHQRHTKVSEIPACLVNVRTLKIGLPVSGANEVVLTAKK